MTVIMGQLTFLLYISQKHFTIFVYRKNLTFIHLCYTGFYSYRAYSLENYRKKNLLQ